MKFLKVLFSLFLSLLIVLTVGCTPKSVEPSDITGAAVEVLRVHFIDVGQGDSTFMELPGGETMLIDAGESEYGSAVANYIKNLGYDTLTYVVGTHPHSDHIGGLEEIIRSFNVGSVYMPKVSSNTETFEDLLIAVKEKGLTVNTAKKDVLIIEKENLRAEILSPVMEEYSNLNNYSAVVMLTYGNNKFLFTGDAEALVEEELLGDLSCDVLKVGHHGSSTSSSDSFLKAARPEYAVISCGKDNKYGHPHSEVLSRILDVGASVLRTDISGNIVIESDGSNIKISENAEVQPPVTSTIVSDQTEFKYILNISSRKIHKPDCGSVKDIKTENRAESYKTVEELKDEGYSPCGNCKPE